MIFGYDPYLIFDRVGKLKTNGSASVSCPFCYKSGESLNKAYFDLRSGKFHCFRCGEKSPNPFVLAKKLGLPKPAYSNITIKDSEEIEEFEWEKFYYNDYAFDNEYLQKRQVDNELIEVFDIREGRGSIQIILKDINKNPVGVLKRNIGSSKIKYVNYGKKPCLLPLDFYYSYDRQKPLVLVEGFFGMVCGFKYGIQTFATMSASIKKEVIPYLSQFSRVIVAFDDDDAGYIGMSKALSMLPNAEAIKIGWEADEATSYDWKNIIKADTTINCIDLYSQIKDERNLLQISFISDTIRNAYHKHHKSVKQFNERYDAEMPMRKK